MKTITDLDLFKASVKPDGKVDITFVGGKQFAGQLTQPELEQFLFRVSAITEGVLTFDPEPQDHVNVHLQDVKTLEAQSVDLETNRNIIKEQAKEIELLTAKLTEAENAAVELGKRLLTVHNVQNTEQPVSTEQTTSVHNVQS